MQRRTDAYATNSIASGLFLRIAESFGRAVSSTVVRERLRELVWRALPWATFSERRDLRSGELDCRAPHTSLRHQGAGAPSRRRGECCGSHQRSRAIREIAGHRPFSCCRRSVRHDGWRFAAGHFRSGMDSANQSTFLKFFRSSRCAIRPCLRGRTWKQPLG